MKIDNFKFLRVLFPAENDADCIWKQRNDDDDDFGMWNNVKEALCDEF